jgi:hypothetical protein
MANGSLEEAKHCPKCQLTGEATGRTRSAGHRPGVTRGALLHEYACRNSRCTWYNTFWFIQINPDGTIPAPEERREKQFHALPDDGGRTQANLEQLLKATEMKDGSASEMRGR